MTAYAVTAARHGGWWALHADVPGASVWTQCRRLDQAESVAREAIALALDEPEDSFDVTVTSTIEDRLRAQIDAAQSLSRLADRAQRAATLMNVSAARSLRHEGLSVRDTGALLSLSSQRISQLIPGSPSSGRAADDDVRGIGDLLDEISAELAATVTALNSTGRGPSHRRGTRTG